MKIDRLRNALARRLDTNEWSRNPDRRRALWLRHYGITLVLDVGANTGQYVRRLRGAGAYVGRVVSFEPGSIAFSALQTSAHVDPLWDCAKLALGDVCGRATLRIAEMSVLNSLLAPLEADPHLGEEDVEIARLDDVAPRYLSPHDRVLLKIDVQGSEIAVLRGAAETLRRVDVIECEVPLMGMYVDQPGFHELTNRLYDLGFSPFSVDPNYVNPSDGHVVDADFVFSRRGKTR